MASVVSWFSYLVHNDVYYLLGNDDDLSYRFAFHPLGGTFVRKHGGLYVVCGGVCGMTIPISTPSATFSISDIRFPVMQDTAADTAAAKRTIKHLEDIGQRYDYFIRQYETFRSFLLGHPA